jgi:hypothetical protein
LALVRDCVKVKTTKDKEKEMGRMEANNTNNHVTIALLSKIQKEEETLSLLIQTEAFAEDSSEHYKMILLQQDVIGFYKAALAQVGARTSLH